MKKAVSETKAWIVPIVYCIRKILLSASGISKDVIMFVKNAHYTEMYDPLQAFSASVISQNINARVMALEQLSAL